MYGIDTDYGQIDFLLYGSVEFALFTYFAIHRYCLREARQRGTVAAYEEAQRSAFRASVGVEVFCIGLWVVVYVLLPGIWGGSR